MPSKILTARQCKAAKCVGVAVSKLHDGGGLYLWTYPNGSKVWRARYWQEGKEKSLSLGVYDTVSLAEARDRHAIIAKQLADGLDPSLERQGAKRSAKLAAENSFEAMANEWLSKQANVLSDRHVANIQRRFEVDIFPALGNRPIGQIQAPEVLQVVRKIEARGSYDIAHRVRGICAKVFGYAVYTGRCSRNPALDLKGALTPYVKRRQNAVKPLELPALLRAIAGYETIGDRHTRIAMQMLALAFVRTGELIGATWDEFTLEKKLWTIPAERMKMRIEHVVPLAPQTIALLEELKPISAGSHYLFPGRNVAKPMSSNTMLFALYRLGFKGKMSGHGFRAVASTILNETGKFNADAIERQLAHLERNQVRAAYHRANYMDERRQLMIWWADHLYQLVR